jgi:hypothetical protein
MATKSPQQSEAKAELCEDLQSTARQSLQKIIRFQDCYKLWRAQIKNLQFALQV